MPLHHRRILFSYVDDHGPCESWYCTSPPAPPPYTPPPPTPSPSPSPSTDWPSSTPPVPDLAPAPSPARHPSAGRRNQGGTNGYDPPTGAATDGHHRRFVTNVLAASAALVFLSLILLGISVAVRRRNLRRQRRQALLAPTPAVATNVGNDDPEGGGGGGVVHHVWYIRTIGLDQAAIDSIAATRYRAGAGLLGAADCSVCLGEFSDGELVRLLPKCGHAFHVPCIDTWLRAHVNCPLCRSDVIEPAAESCMGSSSNEPADPPDVNDIAEAEQVAVAIDDSTPEHEDEDNGQEEPHVEEDHHEQQLTTSPEPLPQLPCPLPWNVRRAASMDAATVSTVVDVAALDRLPEAAPEGEQSDRVKDRTDTDGHTTSTERLGHPRFFFSRHCRARSSVLPL